jgi:2-C-methyl-D-erythritol 4-phosphate cytidylyltransferase/2-C-methyl-D-erythritol 2,4-cyclodiphosphate synthase
MKAWAVIVAAGKGVRAHTPINKVYMPLGEKSVLETCLGAFQDSGLFDGASIVIAKEDEPLFSQENRPRFVKLVVYGGNSRQESVFNGLKSVPKDVELVAVHDAARPFVTTEIIRATLDAAAAHGSGVISTPVIDTIKQVDREGIVRTLDRGRLFAVQTPQTFRLNMLLSAHERAMAEGYIATDDAALFERYYKTVHLVTAPGAERNRKLTTWSDFMAATPDFRVGQGYDAHRLTENRKLILCGVEIPHELGLDGHSDADAALHALMDAMLGAAALGDIGRHFPDTDGEFKNISSMRLLAQTVQILLKAGYSVSNADVTIVAQRPKLAPYIEKMRKSVADALALGIERVNVKATTSEGLGFEGAEQGISAHAVVMIAKGSGI